VLRDLDYGSLKKSFEFLVEHFMPTEVLTPDAHPVRVLERMETQSEATARRGLYVAIGDFVEATQDLPAAEVQDTDSQLEARGAYSLSFLRSHFSRRRDKT
jgi:hypothetical protein